MLHEETPRLVRRAPPAGLLIQLTFITSRQHNHKYFQDNRDADEQHMQPILSNQ